jgi:hypothetical protein
MHRIAKQHGFIIANLVQQIFVPLDKVGLPVGVQLARHCFRLAMLHAQPMQQRDQARVALNRRCHIRSRSRRPPYKADARNHGAAMR